VVLGHPVVFPSADPDQAERALQAGLDRLRAAAGAVGFESVEFYPEPAAAVTDVRLEDGYLLAVDFGAGTFDTAVIEFRDSRPEVRALEGVAIGGDQFDEALFEVRVGPALGLADDRCPAWLYNDLRSLSGARHLLTDRGLPQLLERGKGAWGTVIRRLLFGGRVYDFYRAIELAKIQLSTTEEARLRFDAAGLELDLVLRRSELESLIRPDLERIEQVILAALRAAGIEAVQVGLVLSTGGSSRIPAFQRLLESHFGVAKVQEQDAFGSVVRGLALRAQALWG
jgi:hypothetical chaperone protein